MMIGQTISSLPVNFDYINHIKIRNGIYDDLYVTHINEELKTPNTFSVPDKWDEETYLHAKFSGNLFAGNTDFGIENTTDIILKRRKKGTYQWFPLYHIVVNSIDDFNFVLVDPYAASGTIYEYAVVPIVNGVEDTYSLAECEVSFDNLVIIDKDDSFSTSLDIEYSQQKNQTVSTILPIEAKYPIFVSNASNDYYTGNISATFLETLDGEYITSHTSSYRERVMEFLNNHKVKFIKEPYGKCWLAAIGSSISDSNNGHPEAHLISFDFTEVGDIESNKDMNRFGLLNIDEEWWT